jgi:hypothetical protein
VVVGQLDLAGLGQDDGCMPERSRKRPRDLNSLAASIVGDATDENPEPEPDDAKDPAAVALGRKRRLERREGPGAKADAARAECYS